MRTVVHLSDLHFGRVRRRVLAPLAAIVRELAPDVVVVSGDLTQRALRAEFEEARAFLDTLPHPQIVVPGNHDVPLLDPIARFFGPMDAFRRHIHGDLAPFHADDELAVLGINTARAVRITSGQIDEAELSMVRSRLGSARGAVVKLLVTHHPFAPPGHARHRTQVGGAARAMAALAECGVDVVLSGHLHLSHVGHSAERFQIGDHSALLVQAGSATSTRGRGEPNAFNVLRVEPGLIHVERFAWERDAGLFAVTHADRFEKSRRGWARAA